MTSFQILKMKFLSLKIIFPVNHLKENKNMWVIFLIRYTNVF